MQISYDKDKVIYAGFFSRLAAFLIDSVLVTAALSVFKLIVWIVELSVGDVVIFKPILFTYNVFDIVFYLLSVGYFVLMTYFCGATIGKFLMKLKVVDVEGQKLSFMTVLLRETVGRYLSALVMYVGYIIVGFDNRKQGLHDKIADTLVIYTHPQPVRKPIAPMPVPQGRPPMPMMGQPMPQGRVPVPEIGQPVPPVVNATQPVPSNVPMQAPSQSVPTNQWTTIIIDMYGVILEESKGNFIPYTYSHFEESQHERLTRQFKEEKLFTKAGYGELSSYEFLSELGYEDPEYHMRDYIENHLTLDKGFLAFAEKYADKYDFVLLSTDVSEWSTYITKYHDLDKYFKHKIVSGDVHLRKPDPKIYELTLEKIGKSAGECVFIDNSVANLRGAEGVGISCILFNRDGEEYEGRIVNSFKELEDKFL